jgi:phospholipase/carboxylesterase
VLDSIDIETGPSPRHAVIWLHGLGADGHDFEPIVPELVGASWPAVRFVFPHAPVRAVTINGGMRMRAWYDILGQEIANRQDEAGVRDSIRKVEKLIERETLRGVRDEHVFLAGFSQGGAIALATALRHPRRLAGVIALSTYLPLADRTDAELSPSNRGLHVFLAHGSVDPVVPQSLGQMTRDWLQAHGYPVDWHSYPMPHSVSAAEIGDLRGWLEARLGAA